MTAENLELRGEDRGTRYSSNGWDLSGSVAEKVALLLSRCEEFIEGLGNRLPEIFDRARLVG